jgi:hypothetical protein
MSAFVIDIYAENGGGSFDDLLEIFFAIVIQAMDDTESTP